MGKKCWIQRLSLENTSRLLAFTYRYVQSSINTAGFPLPWKACRYLSTESIPLSRVHVALLKLANMPGYRQLDGRFYPPFVRTWLEGPIYSISISSRLCVSCIAEEGGRVELLPFEDTFTVVHTHECCHGEPKHASQRHLVL